MATIDPLPLLEARVALELALHPDPPDAEIVTSDLQRFIGSEFRGMDLNTALDVLAQEDDTVRVGLLRADAMLDVLRAERAGVLPPEPARGDALRRNAVELLRPINEDLAWREDTADELLRVFEEASVLPTREERWAFLRDNAPGLVPAVLLRAPHPSCDGRAEPYPGHEGELVARITTIFTLPYDGRTIDDLAAKLVPEMWPSCNSFFCSMIHRHGMEQSPGPASNLAASNPTWRGTYHERVGRCPDGSLEKVFLDVHWTRQPDLVCLTYDLVPDPDSDVEVDMGYVIVQAGTDGFAVSTEKWLRFNPAKGWSDGHSLALMACAMGWLDIVIDMTVCGQSLTDVALAPDGHVLAGPGSTSPLPGVDLSACAQHAREAADRYAKQADEASSAIRAGTFRTPDAVALATGVAFQVMADAMRCALEAFAIAKDLVGAGQTKGA